MKFTGATAFISAAYLISLVSAQIISVTSPLTGTKYQAGQNAIISWVNPKVPTISQIVLARGPSTGLQPILTIATNVNANDMKYVWKVPFELENAKDYAFEFGTSPDLAFAGAFEIEGAVGGTLPASNTTASNSAPAPVSSSPAAAAPVSGAAAAPGSGVAAAPAAPATTATTTSHTSPHSASSSSTSAANKQTAGQAVVVLGVVAAAISQFF